ncbi:MAG: winged helix-turn-helix domain-containing protein [Candidatus Bathyarchaeia archaeon]
MRRSKLECYEEILGALVSKPLSVDRLAYETSIECSVLKQRLESLIKYGLVEERVSGRKTLYAITERGVAVFKALNFQKYLEKVLNKVKVLDEAFEVIPKISKNVEQQ